MKTSFMLFAGLIGTFSIASASEEVATNGSLVRPAWSNRWIDLRPVEPLHDYASRKELPPSVEPIDRPIALDDFDTIDGVVLFSDAAHAKAAFTGHAVNSKAPEGQRRIDGHFLQRIDRYGSIGRLSRTIRPPADVTLEEKMVKSAYPSIRAIATSKRETREAAIRRFRADLARREPERAKVPPLTIPKDQAVRFAEFKLTADSRGKTERINSIYGWFPVGRDTDLIWNKRSLYVVWAKDEITEVWRTAPLREDIRTPVYDGRYVWVPVDSRNGPPRLLVVDVEKGLISEIYNTDGLPLGSPKDVQKGTAHALTLAPVSPGRVCVVGSTDRTWIALVDFDPAVSDKVKVDVIHEAREAAQKGSSQQWTNPHIAFKPTYMFTLSVEVAIQDEMDSTTCSTRS